MSKVKVKLEGGSVYFHSYKGGEYLVLKTQLGYLPCKVDYIYYNNERNFGCYEEYVVMESVADLNAKIELLDRNLAEAKKAKKALSKDNVLLWTELTRTIERFEAEIEHLTSKRTARLHLDKHILELELKDDGNNES